MLAYLNQNSEQSLADGLAEYHREHPFLTRGDQLSADAREFFRNHDVVHVVYGCGTSLTHEAVVKLSSFFGTTGGREAIDGYRLNESHDIYKTLRLVDILTTIAHAFIVVPRTLWRCARQTAQWPWAGHEAHLNTPLRDLRARYHIRVAGRLGA